MSVQKQYHSEPEISDHQKGIQNLLLTCNWLEDQQRNFFKEFDITTQQHNVLRILQDALPEPCTLNIIKACISDKNSDASRLVDRLQTKGYIHRQPNPYDRRAVNLSLTEQGRELLASIDLRIHKVETLLSTLDEYEIKQLNHLLDKIRSR